MMVVYTHISSINPGIESELDVLFFVMVHLRYKEMSKRGFNNCALPNAFLLAFLLISELKFPII